MLPLLLLLTQNQGPDTAALDQWAQKRDTASLSRFLTPDSLKPMNPLEVLKSNGAYDVGRFGWHVLDLNPGPDASYVVFSTPLTSEDIGEMVFNRVGGALQYVPEDDALGVRIKRHNFDVSFDIPSKTVTITDAITFTPTAPTKAGYFIFRMSPYLHVDTITSEGNPVTFQQSGGVTAMSKASVFNGREEAQLKITYHGVVNQPQYAGSIVDNEAQLTNDYWYPMIARYPAAFDITVHSPKGWMAIAQGNQVSMNEDASGRTTTYKMDLPVTYYSLSIAPYKMATQMDGNRRISAWSLIRTPEQLQEQTELYKPILRFYNDNFAPFPFEGYGALCSNLYGGGALEAYSFATYGFGVPDEDAHEPSHTWWGGMIDNTYLHSMWNESFAVFCEGLYARHVPIGDQGERAAAFISNAEPRPSYNVATCEEGSPWYGPAASDLGYGKGAAVLQMLETEIGTPMMLKTMQEWQKENPKGQPGEWSGYERAVANVTHKDYNWFFEEWLRRKGWAHFEVKNVNWKAGLLTGDVYFSGDPYRIDCEVLLVYPDGKREYKTFNTMQTNAGDHYDFTLPVATKPSIVSVDPWLRILRDSRENEAPPSLEGAMANVHRYSDPKHPDWLGKMGGTSLDAIPQDLGDTFLVGSPETLPAMAPLCQKVGFEVKGNKLTYRGTTIDLNNGGAMALVDLPGGKHCVIGLGTYKVRPKYGRARLVLFDGLGRFLRGQTQPKTTGWMTFPLGPHAPKIERKIS